jgi:thiamine-monophosphate kinase
LDESDKIIISGVAFGQLKKGTALTRSGAKAGDLVVVTGTLGAASAGLKILLEKLPQAGFRPLVDAQLRPAARVKEGLALVKSGAVNAAIDITDGLASNLWQISRESKVKITIERELIPENPMVRRLAAAHGFKVDDFVLFGGEDFELLFTVRPVGWPNVKRALERIGTSASVIGRVEAGHGVFMKTGGRTRPLPDRGYEHFK